MIEPEEWMKDAGEFICRQWGITGYGDPRLVAQAIQSHYLERDLPVEERSH